MAILLTPLFLSLGPYCVTTFLGRPHNEDVSLPPASKVAAFADRKELYRGHCPSDTGETEQGRASPPSILQTERRTEHGVD